MNPEPTLTQLSQKDSQSHSRTWMADVLGWSAWQRVLVVLPLLALLWLAVFWALPQATVP